MKKLTIGLIFALPVALLVWACSMLIFAPAEPPFDWIEHMSVVDHNALVANIDHHYTVAAYVITWAIQLGYLAWLGLRWQTQKLAVGRILPESFDFQKSYAKEQNHPALNAENVETIAARSDEELLSILADSGKMRPEINKAVRAQLRERGIVAGVGGWLSFLCVYLTILAPIGVALQIVGFSIGFYQNHGYLPRIGDGELGLPLLLYLILASFAVLAGAGLWGDRRKNAVNVAKKYFIATVIVSLLHPFVSYFTWNDRFFNRPTVDDMVLPTLISVAFSVLLAVIWTKYLDRSERVRNTYVR